MSWSPPQGRKWEAVKARREEILAWCNDYLTNNEIEARLGLKKGTWGFYRKYLNLPRRNAVVALRLRSAPDLKPILLEQGEAAFHATYEEQQAAIAAGAEQQRIADAAREQEIIESMLAAIAGGQGRNAAIREARRLGARLEAVGQALGITRERVRQIGNGTRELGDKPSTKPQQFDYAEILADYKSGLLAREVAERHGCSLATVYQICAGCRPRGRPRKDWLQQRQFAEAYEQAWIRQAEYLRSTPAPQEAA